MKYKTRQNELTVSRDACLMWSSIEKKQAHDYHVGGPAAHTHTDLLDFLNEFGKAEGHRINIENISIAFVYMNSEQLKKELRKQFYLHKKE